MDRKFEAAFGFDPHTEPPPDGLVDEIAVAVTSFVRNIERVAQIAQMPVILVPLAMSRQFIRDRAVLKVTGKIVAEGASTSITPAQQAIIAKEYSNEYAAWVREDGANPNASRHAAHLGISTIRGLSQPNDDGLVDQGIEAIYRMMVLGTWTAFETLAADLWVRAIDAEPAGLAALSGTPKRIANRANESSDASEDDDEDALSEQLTLDTSKSVLLKDIERVSKGTYDLQKHMGKLLARRFKFISLAGTRKAYSVAFSERLSKRSTGKIDAALSHRSLDVLSLVRNLLVHRAGTADAVYLEKSKHLPGAIRLNMGQELQMDGDMVRNLIDPVVSCCKDLIQGVNAWILLTRNENAARKAEK